MKQGWEIKKLGECFEYIKNGANIKQERGAGGIPITRIETLSGGIFNRDRLGYADIETIDKYQSYVMESGDLLLSHINSKSYIGRVVVYAKEGNETIIHGMNLLRLKVIPDIISPFYMYYYSQTHKFKSQIANRRKDAVNQSSISVTDLKTIDVPIPPREEQDMIVAELDCLSGVIEKKREQLKELDALAQSIFYQIFGDPITNEKGWEVKKWEEVFDTRTGKLNANVMNENGKYPFFTCSKDIFYIDTYAFDCEALLLAGNNATANYDVKYYKGKFNAYQRTYVLTLKDNSLYKFFKFALENKLSLLQEQSIGGMTKYLTLGILHKIEFIVPPLALQQEFADKIETIEKQKELIEQSITQTETLFNARMDYYFN